SFSRGSPSPSALSAAKATAQVSIVCTTSRSFHFCQRSSSPASPEFSTLRDGSTFSSPQRPPRPHPSASRSSTTSKPHSPPIPPRRSPDPFPAAPHGSAQPPSPRSCLSHFSALASTFTKVKAGRRGAPLRPAVHVTLTISVYRVDCR